MWDYMLTDDIICTDLLDSQIIVAAMYQQAAYFCKYSDFYGNVFTIYGCPLNVQTVITDEYKYKGICDITDHDVKFVSKDIFELFLFEYARKIFRYRCKF